jgi:hypothetical protein
LCGARSYPASARRNGTRFLGLLLALAAVRNHTTRRRGERVARGAGELTLEVGERLDDLRRLVCAIASPDRYLAQDVGVNETLDSVVGRLERSFEQRRRALGAVVRQPVRQSGRPRASKSLLQPYSEPTVKPCQFGVDENPVESPAQSLDRLELRAKQLIWAGVIAALAGLLVLILVPANHPSPPRDPRVIFIGVTLVAGPVFALMMPRQLSLLRQARLVLADRPSDLLLSARFRRTLYGGARDGAWLFRDRDGGLPVAGFSLGSPPWSRPFRLAVTRTPAKVYGAPERGSVVVVTFNEGMLVGRIGRTQYRDVQSMSPIGRWLFKQRRLHLPGKT